MQWRLWIRRLETENLTFSLPSRAMVFCAACPRAGGCTYSWYRERWDLLGRTVSFWPAAKSSTKISIGVSPTACATSTYRTTVEDNPTCLIGNEQGQAAPRKARGGCCHPGACLCGWDKRYRRGRVGRVNPIGDKLRVDLLALAPRPIINPLATRVFGAHGRSKDGGS